MSAADEPDGPRFPAAAERWALAAFVLVVAASLGVSLLAARRPLTAGTLALVVAGGAVFVLWGIFGERLCERRGSRPLSVLYFVVQLTLGGLLLDQVYRLHTVSIAWLILLPLVGQALLLLSAAGAFLVAFAGLALFLRPVVLLGGWDEAPAAAASYAVACLFIVAFVQVAIAAERARAASARLAADLTTARERLAEYAVQATELATARERARLAREIHDSVGHSLTVVHVQVEAARALLDAEPGRVAEALAKAGQATREGLAEIRRSVAALRSSPLDGRSLDEAVRELVDGGVAGVVTELEVRGAPRALPPQAALTLYRAAQEGLTNVGKHARATAARVVLDFADDRVRLTVSDDGVGGTAEEGDGGFGLLGLRERVRLARGRLTLDAAPGEGFSLDVEIPA